MATTVSYSASMRTRKASSSSNAKSSAACQEFYDNSYDYVGIVHFSGMALSGKVITGISLSVTADKAGYGTGHTKTVYVRKSNYQSASQSGITGGNYYGDALGTFTGAFYGNTTSYTFSGTLLDNLAAYFAAGNNTICLFNPSSTASSQGYSNNYMMWSECTITVTYEEAASKPSLSKSAFDMGTSVTVYTNRQSTLATHAMLEVRNSAYASSLDYAVMLRVCADGSWGNYRMFHAGMPTPIPIANGGTGASSAKAALSNHLYLRPDDVDRKVSYFIFLLGLYCKSRPIEQPYASFSFCTS